MLILLWFIASAKTTEHNDLMQQCVVFCSVANTFKDHYIPMASLGTDTHQTKNCVYKPPFN